MALIDSLPSGVLIGLVSKEGGLYLAARGSNKSGSWKFEANAAHFAGNSIPQEAILVVFKTKDGQFLGLRSPFADGKVLQVTKSKHLDLRFDNHNFGFWEQWSLSGDSLSDCRLINRQFADKYFDVSIHQYFPVTETSVKRLSTLEETIASQMSSKDVGSSDVHSGDDGPGNSSTYETGTYMKLAVELVAAKAVNQKEGLVHAKLVKELESKITALQDNEQNLVQEAAKTKAAMEERDTEVSELATRLAAAEEAAAQVQSGNLIKLEAEYGAKLSEAKAAADAKAEEAEAKLAALQLALQAAEKEAEYARQAAEAKSEQRIQNLEAKLAESNAQIEEVVAAAESVSPKAAGMTVAGLVKEGIAQARREAEARYSKLAETRIAEVEAAARKATEQQTSQARKQAEQHFEERIARARAQFEADIAANVFGMKDAAEKEKQEVLAKAREEAVLAASKADNVFESRLAEKEANWKKRVEEARLEAEKAAEVQVKEANEKAQASVRRFRDTELAKAMVDISADAKKTIEMEVEKARADLQGELESAKEKLQLTSARLAETVAKLEETQAKLAAVEVKMANGTAEKSSGKAAIRQLADLEAKLRAAEDQVAAEAKKRKREVEAASSREVEQELSRGKLEAKLEETKLLVSELQAAADAAEQRAAAAAVSLEEESGRVRSWSADMQARLQRTESEKKAAIRRAAEFEAQLSHERLQLQTQVGALVQENASLLSEISVLQGRLQEVIAERDASNEELNKPKSFREVSMEGELAMHKQKAQEAAVWRSRVQEMEQKLRDAEGRSQHQMAMLAQEGQRVSELELSIQDLQSQLSANAQGEGELEAAILDVTERVQAAEADAASARQQVSAYEEEAKELHGVIAGLKEKLRLVEVDKLRVKKEAKEARKLDEAKEKAMADLKGQLEGLKEALRSSRQAEESWPSSVEHQSREAMQPGKVATTQKVKRRKGKGEKSAAVMAEEKEVARAEALIMAGKQAPAPAKQGRGSLSLILFALFVVVVLSLTAFLFADLGMAVKYAT